MHFPSLSFPQKSNAKIHIFSDLIHFFFNFKEKENAYYTINHYVYGTINIWFTR